ncbi:MAG: hypothetical protein KC425_17320 [Anaerolineales bacterium]|nr:hypothetical protein [Anaerolineales bacterium]
MTSTHLRSLLPLLLLLSLLAACRRGAAPPPVVGEVDAARLKIEVAQDGLYRISRAALQDAGLALETLGTDAVSLSQAGTAVPFLVADDHLVFYGQAPASRYTATRPYILTANEPGTPMPETPAPAAGAPLATVPQTLRLEEDLIYTAQARREETSDVWFWREIGQQQQVDLSFSLPAVDAQPATLTFALWGVTQDFATTDDHDFDVVLNDQRVGTVRGDGMTHFGGAVDVPAGVLRAGNNRLLLDNQVPGAAVLDIMQLNWLELTYSAPSTAVNDRFALQNAAGHVALSGFSGTPLIVDVADPAAPRLLTDWSCSGSQACLAVTPEMHVVAAGPAGFRQPAALTPLRQSSLAAADNRADLIILTTDALAPALAPLVAAREAAGLGVAVVPVAQVYDAFGYGEASPFSIQAFLAYALENWTAPAPRYLLIVGDATSDYRNYLGLAPNNVVPPLMVPVAFSGETVSDARLADVDGDMQADLAVGRWPAQTPREVDSLVARTLAYEQGAAPNRALFAADGTEPQFAEFATRLAAAGQIAPEAATFLTGPSYADVVANWNDGAWLTTYVGHGSLQRWGKEDVLNEAAIADLDTSSPSIVLQLTCLSGLFAHPEQTSLTEEMMRHPTGPILHVAATSLTLSNDQEIFATALLANLQDPAYARIGDAFLAAKQTLNLEQPGLREISDTFTLFGDPSAQIVRPDAAQGS